MHDDSIKLLEMPEHNSISLCVYVEHDGLFALGERINAQYPMAYMNGYNWEALIRFYLGQVDPDLAEEINPDPEAGMYAAYMKHSPENLAKMKRFESHVRQLLSDETELMDFIAKHQDEIEWD